MEWLQPAETWRFRTAILDGMVFVIKAEVRDLRTKTFKFTAQKTMYGGKNIAKGDAVFIFASENEGGRGLIACGVVCAAESIAKKAGLARQTPRVSVTVKCMRPQSGLWGGATLSASAIGRTVDPKPSSISSSIAKQQTRSPVYPIRPQLFSTIFSQGEPPASFSPSSDLAKAMILVGLKRGQLPDSPTTRGQDLQRASGNNRRCSSRATLRSFRHLKSAR